MKTEFCQYWLTCKDQKEADKIANTLLVKHLVVCAKQIPIRADYRWKGKVERSNEVLLIMESQPEVFEKIEAEVAKLHSYDTFVLEEVSISKISSKAEGWLHHETSYGSE